MSPDTQAPKKLDHPYVDLAEREALRSTLHAHPRPRERPFDLLKRYADHGYGVVALTEHDRFYSREDIADWDDHGLVVLLGCEITAGGPHVLYLGADRQISPHPDRQQVIDEINATSGFAIVNHPNGGQQNDHCTLDEMRRLQEYVGMEIFNANALRGADDPAQGAARAFAHVKWDALLAAGRRLWGIATDDYHEPSHLGEGWVTIWARERSPASVLEALRHGCFYASCGAEIERIEVDGMRVRIGAPEARRITALGPGCQRLARESGGELEFQVPPDVAYVRFECQERGARWAWTQPFWVVDA